MGLLQRMVDEDGIQVLFMLLKPQEHTTAASSHHMWTDEMVLFQTQLIYLKFNPNYNCNNCFLYFIRSKSQIQPTS